jgi:hypothetical protein
VIDRYPRSRVIRRALGTLAGLLLLSASASAQNSPGDSRPLPTAAADGIVDNSFLVEETFNQDPGIIQTQFTWLRADGGDWEGAVSQDWPLLVHRHQFSYTLPWDGGSLPAHIGQAVVSYRYQIADVSDARPGLAARLSVILPTGREGDDDRPGLQAAIPMTAVWRRLHVHANAGLTWTHQVRSESGATASLTSPYLAASVVWPTASMLQLMLEDVVEFEALLDANARRLRRTTMTVSPGLRGGWNVGRNQVVLGAAVPIDASDSGRSVSVLGYVSLEGPFRRNR